MSFDDEIAKIEKIPNTTHKTKYYATIENNSLNIYTKPPTNTTKLEDQSIIDFVTNDITSYKIVDDVVPNDTDYIEFYVFEPTSEIADINEFKVSDNKYIFPSVSATIVDKPEESKKTKGTPITGGTDPRKLVVSTTFNGGGRCSGIAIGNYGQKDYIYTAAHCLKTPGSIADSLPASATQNGKSIEFVKDTSGVVLYDIPVKKTTVEDSNKYYIESADDVGILYTTSNSDTTNVFLLDNCEDIPKDTQLSYWGAITKWSHSRLIDDSDLIDKIVISGKIPSADFNELYPDWKINDNYKKYFRIIEKSPQGGDSGGPHGFFFNRDTKEITGNGDCFAICFTTGSEIGYNNGSKDIKHGLVISASRWINWIQSLNKDLKINIAHYENGKINIVPSTTSGGSKKTFRVSRRKYTTK